MNQICYMCNQQIPETDNKLHGLHVGCFQHEFSIGEGVDFKDVSLRHQASSGNPTGTNESKHKTSFFHGKFRKYSATLGGQNYILKMQEEGYKELPVTEFLCNQIAKQLRFKVPKFSLIKFQNNIITFVTRNFMQDYTASNLVHLYHFVENEKDWNCEKIIKQLEKTTSRLSEMEKFVKICLFDALIGNNDRHGRNLGLINRKNRYLLSPFYDNPSNIGVEIESLLGAQLEPKGSIATMATTEPSMKDYVIEFKRLEYGDVCKQFLENVQKNKLAIKNLINNSFLSPNRKKALRDLMNRRYKELVKNV